MENLLKNFSASGGQGHTVIRGARLFMIEDDIANQSIAKMILESYGANVAFNRWGTDTVADILAFKPVDLILLDMMFPDNVSGFDIFAELHSHPDLQSVPVVAITAMDASQAVPRCRELGFSGYIGKPLNMMTFPTIVARILGGEHVWEYR
ncbi:MAG: response regulator [Anaerolineae bacterium]|nr:response regulator [Anaerolineae bacterium]